MSLMTQTQYINHLFVSQLEFRIKTLCKWAKFSRELLTMSLFHHAAVNCWIELIIWLHLECSAILEQW